MDRLQGKRVLITGANGFIGANLAETLVHRGADVHALVRPGAPLWRLHGILPQMRLHQANLLQDEALRETAEKIRPEWIFHFAVRRGSVSQSERLDTLQTNVLGLFNLLEAIAPLDYRCFVYAGSSLEYGPRDEPLSEADNLLPKTFFGATKAASTIICRQYAQANKRPIVMLRIFSVYGYWEPPTRLIPTAIMTAFGNGEMDLTAPGYRRDFVFIEDVVDACLMAINVEDPWGKIINIGSGQQWTNEEAIEAIQEITGRTIRVRVGSYPARGSDTSHWVADIQRARLLLGWEPRHTLHQGLKKTVAWFRLHQEMYHRQM
jgi:nucleoside-diphosphate-sugar epimerase